MQRDAMIVGLVLLSTVPTAASWGQAVCRWGGLAGGMDGFNPWVYSLAVFDDGTGSALYASGNFVVAGGVAARNIARWDGASWSPVGGGMLNGSARSMIVFDDGTGPALYAGGNFWNAGSVPGTSSIAKWDGSSWHPLGGGFDRVIESLVIFDDGGGPALYAGGWFTTAGGVKADHIARWDGVAWHPVGGGMNTAVGSLVVFDDGTGPALYAGGWFTTAGGVEADYIARWDGVAWSPLASGLNWFVRTLAVFDDGTGPALYAGGAFGIAGGVSAARIARWDGTAWSGVGGGLQGFPGGGHNWVEALAVFDDGTGPALYVGGQFAGAGGVPATRIARWDGVSWSALGSGTDAWVHEMIGFDDGTGPALFVGGDFSTAGGAPSTAMARWFCDVCPGDLTESGLVNGADLALLLENWGAAPPAIGDLTRDGVVDGADLAVLLGQWGPCP